jgi:hypothetical protein
MDHVVDDLDWLGRSGKGPRRKSVAVLLRWMGDVLLQAVLEVVEIAQPLQEAVGRRLSLD